MRKSVQMSKVEADKCGKWS